MTYVLSDIHGNERRFQSIMEQIQLKKEDTLYVLGDVVDRHPCGIRILRKIMAMPNAKMLLGNHEYMMLRALGEPYDDYTDTGNALSHWYRNGGKVTHDHWKRIRKTTRAQIIEHLHALPLNVDVQVGDIRYKLVHGAPVEDYCAEPKYQNATHFSVWKRLDMDAAPPCGYTLIFGHTPTKYYADICPMQIWKCQNRIGIDCGSGYPETGEESAYGRLACLRLDDGMIFYSEESGS